MTSAKSSRAVLLMTAVAFLLTAGPAHASDCPQCDVYQNWLTGNGGACGYHGARLPSICEADPECLRWNRECREMRDQLSLCLARCRQAPPRVEPPAREPDDRDTEAMERDRNATFPAGSREAQIALCQENRQRHQREDPEHFPGGAIGTVIGVAGPVHVEGCQGAESRVLRHGDPIYLKDLVRTGSRGRVRIRLNDYDPDSPGRGPSFISIGTNSELAFETYQVKFNPVEKTGSILLDFLKGKMRAFLRGWSRNTSFSVKAGVAVCGIRGSDVVMTREPSSGTAEVFVIEGHARLSSEQTGQGHELPAGTHATAVNGGVGSPRQLSRAEWNQLMVRHGLNLGEGLDPDIGSPRVLPLACRRMIGRWLWFTGYSVDFAGDGSWRTTDGVHRGTWKCLPDGRGGASFLVIPDAGGWQDTVVIGPDGTSLSGENHQGVPVRATRAPSGQ